MTKPWRLALLLALAPMTAWAAEETSTSCPPTKPDNLPQVVLTTPSGNKSEGGIPPQLQPGDYYNGFQTGTHVVSSDSVLPDRAVAAHCVLPRGRTGPLWIP